MDRNEPACLALDCAPRASRIGDRHTRTRCSPARIPLLLLAAGFLGLSSFPSESHAGSGVVGSFVMNTTTGTQVVSHSLGETPKLIITWTNLATSESVTTDARFSVGAADGTSERTLACLSDDAFFTSNCIEVLGNKAALISSSEADLTSWNSTTFTLNWTSTSGVAATVHYMLIGGTDVSAKVHTWNSSGAGSGTQAVTGVGFEPDVVLTFFSESASSIGSTVGQFDFSMGAFDSTGRQWANSVWSVDNSGTSNTQRGQRTNACFLALNSDLTDYVRASYSSMDSDGFTVNWALNPSVIAMNSICIKGLNAHVGSFNKSTGGAPASQPVTGVNFEPELLLLSSWQSTASGSNAAHTRIGFGAADGTNEGSIATHDQDGVGITSADRVGKTSKVFVKIDNNSQTIDAEADLSSFDANGFTLNWTTNDAVATQICYVALVPFSSIEVRLTEASVTETPQGARVEWTTEREVDNLGFHIHRERKGLRTRQTQALIHGSATMLSAGTATRAAKEYRWLDRTSAPGDAYWIEDIDLSGQSTFHGPYFPSPNRLGHSLASGPVTSLAQASLSSTPTTPPLRRIASDAPGDPTVASWLARQEGLGIEVVEEGWIEVTQEQWIAAGLSPGVDPRDLQLFLRGQIIAIEVSDNGDASFDPGESIRFYGLGSETLWSKRSLYQLIESDREGLRIAMPGKRANPSTLSNHFVETIEDREISSYISSLRNGDEDNFAGPLVSDSPLVRSLHLDHREPTSLLPITLQVELQGIGSSPHEVQVQVNGTPMGVIEFTGAKRGVKSFAIHGALVPGAEQSIELRATNAGDFSFLRSLRVSYPRRFVLESGALRASITGPGSIRFEGTGLPIRVFDVTDETSPRELPTQTVIGPSGNVTEVTLQSLDERILYAIDATALRPPLRTRPLLPSNWRNEGSGGTFVVISPRAHQAELAPLLALRRSEGLTTVAVVLEDLEREFGDGDRTPYAIRAFLRHADATWREKPRYLLLVGDATYDPGQRLAGTPETLLPTKLIDSARLETASDAWFGDLDEDGIAEIAVGRFPVKTHAETALLVGKSIAYAQSSTAAGSRKRALLVADDDDTHPFEDTLKRAQLAIDPSFSVETISLNQSSVEAARSDLAAELRNGVGVVGYFGHGGTETWGAESILTGDDVRSLDNEWRLPVVLATCCLNGFFQRLSEPSLSESWLLAPNGGAIAVWSSSDMTNPHTQAALSSALLSALTEKPGARLGDSWLASQRSGTGEIRRTTILLGDPTVRYEH